MTWSVVNPNGDNHKTGVTWGQRVGEPECPYLRRWVFNYGFGSVRVHHWTGSDDPRHLHDHAWWFVTFVVKGGYTDIHETGARCMACDGETWTYSTVNGKCSVCDDTKSVRRYDLLNAPSVRFRRANHAHTVQIHRDGCWTVMVTGRPLRDWGFWVDGEFKRMRRYFREHGHHPCG